jgi:hypothetical protein
VEDWIILNKEWFLSGAGIFIVGGIFSFLTVLVTLWFKGRSERKKRKLLQLAEKLVKFELPRTEGEIDNGSLSVSYKGSEYKHLCHYTLSLENSGNSAIENQNLLFSFPMEALILEQIEVVSNSSINVSSEKISGTNDLLYTIDRLESRETLSLTMLINVEASEAINCKPRGVDNIDYAWGKTSSTSDVELLVFFLATFVVVDIVPFMNSALQGLVILASAPLLVRIAGTLFNKKSAGNIVNISGGLNVTDEAMVTVHQSDSSSPNKLRNSD